MCIRDRLRGLRTHDRRTREELAQEDRARPGASLLRRDRHGSGLQARQAVSGRIHWGLRARLIVALVGVALLAADMATVYSNLNLDSHVAAAACLLYTSDAADDLL